VTAGKVPASAFIKGSSFVGKPLDWKSKIRFDLRPAAQAGGFDQKGGASARWLVMPSVGVDARRSRAAVC